MSYGTPTYSNFAGSGRREWLIDVTTNAPITNAPMYRLVDGNIATGNGNGVFANSAATGVYFEFAFPWTILVTEFTWYQDAAGSQGVYTLSGSNDNSTFTTITTGLDLGGASATDVHSFSNTVGYQYYKLTQTSGTLDTARWMEEIQFKCAFDTTFGTGTPGTFSYSNTGGQGNRVGTMLALLSTTTACGADWPSGINQVAGDMLGMLDGTTSTQTCDAASAFVNGGTGLTITYGFRVPVVIDEFTWIQQSVVTHGTWKFQGSTDGITFVDLQTGINLGGLATTQAYTIGTATSGYNFYRLAQTAGSTSSTPWLFEIQFKTATLTPGAGGTWASTEATDTFATTGYPGYPGVGGQFYSTEAADTIIAIGLTSDLGLWRSTEAKDIFGASGRVVIQGPWASTEATDYVVAAGVGFGQNGIWASTENPDIFAASAGTPITGTFVTTEITDRFVALGAGVTRARRRRQLIVA